MAGAVTGDKSSGVLNFRLVVAQRTSSHVAHEAAGTPQDCLSPADVPLARVGGGLHISLSPSGNQQGNFCADAPARNFCHRSEACFHSIDYGVAMRPRNR